MRMPKLKGKVSKSNTKVFSLKKKIAFGLSSIFLCGLVLQMIGGVSIGNFINPTATAQTKRTKVVDKDEISPEVLQQIQALENEKESRTPAQQKIDSRLLYTIKMERGESLAANVPTLETGLEVDAEGYIDVDISANVSDSLMKQLKGLNAEIIAVFPQYHSITARLPISAIETLAETKDILFIQPKQELTTNKIESPGKKPLIGDPREAAPKTPAPIKDKNKNAAPPSVKKKPDADFQVRAQRIKKLLAAKFLDINSSQTGTVTSEADTTHRAALARMLSGANGTGIKIGVLSNGVDTLAARQASGDLPATVTVLTGQAGTGDEGTAMLELIYDLAPGAQLYYATGNPTAAQFATNIRNLRAAGCDIIVDDISYFNETPFQNGQAANVVSPGNAGVVVQAVNDVTAAGALYFSSAANSGNKNDNTSGAWEGDFVDGGATVTPIATGNRLHDFGDGVTQNVLTVAGRVILKWSDPLGASANDYDLYALNAAGTAVVTSSTNVQSGTQDPVEDVGNRTVGQRIVIVKKTAAANRFLHLNTNRGQLTISTAGVVYGHNAGLNTISVAATPAAGPFPKAHSSSNMVETFSSDGPRRIFYNADGTAITPGNVSATGGQLLQKPDITAADGVTTTTPGYSPFFGTSAAAPDAAALMALLKQASPSSNNTQLYNAMTSSAIDIEAAGVDRDSGTGIFMPLRAMAALDVPGPAFLDNGTPVATEAVGNGNGRIEPGETANLTIPLNNVGLADASGVTATLTTSTPGVTILNNTSNYSNIAKGVGTAANATPYRFSLSNNFPCGGNINFALTVNYTGGSNASQMFNFTIDTAPPSNTATTLDTTAPAATANYTATTGTQTGRLARTGVTSSCEAAKAAPGLTVTTGERRYDAYTYTAASSGCITVTLSAPTTALYSAAYNNSGFVPANPNTNYLADAGSSGTNTSYSFNVTAGQTFTVVVHEVDVNGGFGTNYTLNVSGAIAGACLAPTAANTQISGRVFSNYRRGVANARVSLTDTSGFIRSTRTNAFGYFRLDGIPAGEAYIVNITAKGIVFTPKVLNVSEDFTDLNFFAEP